MLALACVQCSYSSLISETSVCIKPPPCPAPDKFLLLSLKVCPGLQLADVQYLSQVAGTLAASCFTRTLLSAPNELQQGERELFLH